MLRIIFSGRMLVALLMGFTCGLPLLLTITLLQARMKEAGVDLALIGMMALVGIPYTVKFLWAPFLDRYTLPFLGRRRGWLFVFQICLILSIAGLGIADPGVNPWMVAFVAFVVTFFSASQDIVVDAYRREDLPDEELGLGSSLYVNGYRVGMLLVSGGGMIMADHISFTAVYLVMACAMIPGLITTLLAREPEPAVGIPGSLREAVFDPLTEYFTRQGAVWILAFILLYKIGDTMASSMTIPFYLDLGFSKTEIGAVVKLFGFWATISGTLIGGIVMIRLGINRSLWVFGLLQALSTGCFALLARVGPNITLLSGVIGFENLSSGMGTAAYVAFMASITDKRFTATQYALLSSLMGVPRVLASAPTGFLVEAMGWEGFFVACALIALPGMVLLIKFAPWSQPSRRLP
ncbi:MAG: AmpG family muropeptide MFS transporter [Deltaproteobacteria bacterium]|nr:AmpG family muropeptide MFS transporter [Deltaproteobacteria bacterium]MBW2049095.1 AmpG family muropeptide MFS transporter [Deltaproteobacteria bacterium]MBW2113106.1 AmpG family muropeptide MFS transporter [Deltaproteobacteria bacterium]MBW2353777.1 AmpG family muropeptide MFS transporter [Deltaproteobacteria bacterium]HDZ91378.1 MFS transporter [Deltaproteobacteria bacterium]